MHTEYLSCCMPVCYYRFSFFVQSDIVHYINSHDQMPESHMKSDCM